MKDPQTGKGWARKAADGALKALQTTWFVVSSIVLPPISIKAKKVLNEKTRKKRWRPYVDWLATIKKSVISFSTMYVFFPASTFLFPRVEDVLKDKGLNPELVEKLSPGDKDIRVRHDNFLGNLHEVYEHGFLFSAITRHYKIGNYEEGLLGYTKNQQQEAFGHKFNMLSMKSHAMLNRGGREILTPEELYKFVLLHELRHTSKDNTSLSPYLCEADADYHAIMGLTNDAKDSALFAKLMIYRSQTSLEKYDNYLYLQARCNKTPMPDEAHILRANKIAHEMFLSYKENLAAGKCEMANIYLDGVKDMNASQLVKSGDNADRVAALVQQRFYAWIAGDQYVEKNKKQLSQAQTKAPKPR